MSGKRFLVLMTSIAMVGACLFNPSARKPPKKTSPLENGWTAYRAGDYAAALDSDRLAQRRDPGNTSILELWGRANLAMGRPGTALGALGILVRKRGEVDDYRLLATADAMAGNAGGAKNALAKAEDAKGATAANLYALACEKPDVAGRLALLKRIAKDFPAAAPKVAPEIEFWSSHRNAVLRSPEKPLPAGGLQVKMKTLYNLEWVVCKSSSGKELWMLVDTAARRSVLSEQAARHFGLKTVQGAFPSAGAWSNEPAHTLALLKTLDIGGYRVDNVPVYVVKDAPGLLKYREGRVVDKGILGMDLLRGMKVRFDRKKDLLGLFPASASKETFIGKDASKWSEYPAFLVYDQVLVKASLSKKKQLMGLLDTGCSMVLATNTTLPGTGLRSSSSDIIDLTPTGNFIMSSSAVGTPLAQMSRVRNYILGWLDECLPMPGRVRTVPRIATVGFGPTAFKIRDLPLFPKELGSVEVPICLVIGRRITNFYAIALDLNGNKMYVKQVLFAKK